MSIPKTYGTCEQCGTVKPLKKYGTQWLCDRCITWEESLQASSGKQKAIEKFLNIFRG